MDLTLPPLVIPHTLPGPSVNDLTTRLGRAYERMMAYTEAEGELMATAYSVRNRASVLSNRLQDTHFPNPKRVKAVDDVWVLANQRLVDLSNIKKALHYELYEAKKEAGQSCPPRATPVKTIAEWDAELLVVAA